MLPPDLFVDLITITSNVLFKLGKECLVVVPFVHIWYYVHILVFLEIYHCDVSPLPSFLYSDFVCCGYGGRYKYEFLQVLG